jgi:hypothetical protein
LTVIYGRTERTDSNVMSGRSEWMVAIAGGSGAFLGAAVGQLLQWLRDLQAEKRVDRRRAEDGAQASSTERRQRRYDEYLAVLKYLHQLRSEVKLAELFAWVWKSEPENDRAREALREKFGEVGDLIRDGLAEATARVDVVGSGAARTAMADLNAHTAGYGSSELSNKVWTKRSEEAFAEFVARRRAGEAIDLFDPAYMVEVERPWDEVASGWWTCACDTLREIDAIADLLRGELDLS